MNEIVSVKEFERALLVEHPIPVGWAVKQYKSLITTIESLKVDLQECERATVMWKKHSEEQEILVIKRESEIESQKEEIEKLQEELQLLKNPKNVVYVIKSKGKPEYVKRKFAEKCFTKNIREAIKFTLKVDAEAECFKDEMVVPYVLEVRGRR